MSSSAVLMFESALRSAVPDPSSSAVSQFEALLKAKKKAPATAPVAPVVQNAPAERLGLGTGEKPKSFDEAYPHLRHGMKFKILAAPTAENIKTIGEDHPDYDKHDLPEYKADNPYEKLARLGYDQQREIGKLELHKQRSETLNDEHPDHKYHLAYVAKLVQQTMDQQARHNMAYRNRHAGAQTPQQAKEAIGSGLWRVTNKRPDDKGQTHTEQPKHFHEVLARIEERGSKDNQSYVRNAVSQVTRAAAVTASLNRMLHSARQLGDKFHSMSAAEFHKHTRENYDLGDFSQARIAPGFTDDHLKNVKGHNPFASGDFTSSGKPTHKPIYFFAPRGKKGAPAQSVLHGKDNVRDVVAHLKTLPVQDGRSTRGSGMKVMHDYLTPAAGAFLNRHTEMFNQ